MAFPAASTRLMRRSAVVALIGAGLVATAGLSLSTLASWEIGDHFREADRLREQGVVAQPPDSLDLLVEGGRTLLLLAAAIGGLGATGLAVGGAFGLPDPRARQALLAYAVGVVVAFVATVLDQIGPRPGDPAVPMLLGAAAAVATIVARRRAALVMATLGLALVLAMERHLSSLPPWFDAKAQVMPSQGFASAWTAAVLLLLASALAMGASEKSDGQHPRSTSGI